MNKKTYLIYLQVICILLIGCKSNDNSSLKIDSLQKENTYLKFQLASYGKPSLILDTLKIYSANHQRIATHSLAYFLEHTIEFKNKTIALTTHFVDDDQNKSLKNKIGQSANFSTFDGLNDKIITINIREGIDVPDIRYKDLVCISFLCQQGSLKEGNIAVKIGLKNRSFPEGIIMSSDEQH